jgi:hypothetical protein
MEQLLIMSDPKYVERICGFCRTPFYARKIDINRGRGLFCSRRCVGLSKYSSIGPSSIKKYQGNGLDNAAFKHGDKTKYARTTRANHPEKHRAGKVLRAAVRAGRIVKPDHCERCLAKVDKQQLEGHHAAYSKPLEVLWLCRDCHNKEHHMQSE